MRELHESQRFTILTLISYTTRTTINNCRRYQQGKLGFIYEKNLSQLNSKLLHWDIFLLIKNFRAAV